MINNINYYGTDPNDKLYHKLLELNDDFKSYNTTCESKVDIRCQGSEEFIDEWKNTMGVAFSSPPYFFLEDYKHGKQSCNKDTKYEDWLNDYYTKTIQNIHKYLVDDGKLIINIKNYDKYKLVEDTIRICEDNGFYLSNVYEFKNSSRITKKDGINKKTKNNESIYIFSKSN